MRMIHPMSTKIDGIRLRQESSVALRNSAVLSAERVNITTSRPKTVAVILTQ